MRNLKLLEPQPRNPRNPTNLLKSLITRVNHKSLRPPRNSLHPKSLKSLKKLKRQIKGLAKKVPLRSRQSQLKLKKIKKKFHDVTPSQMTQQNKPYKIQKRSHQ